MSHNATANTANSATGIPATAGTSGSPASGSAPAKAQDPVIRFKPRRNREIQSQPDVLILADGELRTLYQELFESSVASQIAAERTSKAKQAIAQVLSRMRRERGWRLAYVAEMVNIHPQSLLLIERGLTVPRDSTLRKMMACYGFTAPTPPILFTSKFSANLAKGNKLRVPPHR